MTRDEIIAMSAGREMDALIYERFDMGITVPHKIDGNLFRSWLDGYECEDTFYSTNICDAWKVVEKMLEYEPQVGGNDQIILTRTDNCKKYYVEFRKPSWEYAEDESAPLAICRAALLAILESAEPLD